MQLNEQPTPGDRNIFIEPSEIHDGQHENTKKHWIKQEIELFPRKIHGRKGMFLVYSI